MTGSFLKGLEENPLGNEECASSPVISPFNWSESGLLDMMNVVSMYGLQTDMDHPALCSRVRSLVTQVSQAWAGPLYPTHHSVISSTCHLLSSLSLSFP